MNDRDDILFYLEKKKQAVFPVEQAEVELTRAQNRLAEADKSFSATSISAGCVQGVVVLFLFIALTDWSSGVILNLGLIIFLGIILLILHLGVKSINQTDLEPVKLELQQAQEKYNQAITNITYQQESEDFPQEFYHSYYIDRLISLVSEGWVNSLPEAYRLLQKQLHQEEMIEISQETRDASIETAELTRQVRDAAEASAAANSAIAATNAATAKEIKEINDRAKERLNSWW